MRFTGLLVLALFLTCWTAFSQVKKSSGVETKPETTAIQGCLTGSSDSYRLQEENGTQHMLIGDAKELQSHVGQHVQLTGKRDLNRDASASSDEATAHGQRFFRVESVTPTEGKCSR